MMPSPIPGDFPDPAELATQYAREVSERKRQQAARLAEAAQLVADNARNWAHDATGARFLRGARIWSAMEALSERMAQKL